jgi:uncharacterized protein YdeI (YjbR/CyaY-like superfamily)
MPNKDPRIDAYLEKTPSFAKPILNRFRKLIHTACPQVEETIKWKAPFFLHKGILAAMGSFKHHCAIILWKGRLIPIKDRAKLRRLTSMAEMPSDKILLGYIRKAIELNETGVKAPKPKKKPDVVVPDYFLAALKKNKKALATFEAFSPSHRREYVQWITEAKREETRVTRIQKAIQQLATGKSLNWKYR